MSRFWDVRQLPFQEAAKRARTVMDRTGKCEGYFATLNWTLYPDAKGPDPDVCPGCWFYMDCPCIKLDEARRLNGKANN